MFDHEVRAVGVFHMTSTVNALAFSFYSIDGYLVNFTFTMVAAHLVSVENYHGTFFMLNLYTAKNRKYKVGYISGFYIIGCSRLTLFLLSFAIAASFLSPIFQSIHAQQT